jgi:hypothetical protein
MNGGRIFLVTPALQSRHILFFQQAFLVAAGGCAAKAGVQESRGANGFPLSRE